MPFNHFSELFNQNIQSSNTRSDNVLEVGDLDVEFIVILLNFLNIKPAQLVKTAFCNGFCLWFCKVKWRNAWHRLNTLENLFKLFSAGTCFTNSNNIINSVLSFDKSFKDMRSCLGFVEFEFRSSLNHRFTMLYISMKHYRQGQQNWSPIEDTHHVG